MIYITKILHHALHQYEKLAGRISFLLFFALPSLEVFTRLYTSSFIGIYLLLDGYISVSQPIYMRESTGIYPLALVCIYVKVFLYG